MKKTLLLIDAHAMIHRAFHALPHTLETSKGVPTGAVYGFFLMLIKVLGDFKPTHLAVAFDTPTKTFRKKLFKEYQAKRPPMDDTLKVQIPTIKELLDVGGVKRIEKPGYEADDVIGTLVELNKTSFDRILILTGDRDLLQLTDEHIFLIAPKQGVTNFDLFTPYEVEKKYGVTPSRIPDYKALAGDSSDNYQAAPGIGPKTAKSLLSGNKTIEDLLAHPDNIENARIRDIIKMHKDKIKLCKTIATIVKDLDINICERDIEFTNFSEVLQKSLNNLELFSLSKKIFSRQVPNSTQTPKKPKTSSQSEQIELF